jgi:hypothetical protein
VARPLPSASTTPRLRISGTPAPTPSAFPVGFSRSRAISGPAAATSSRATRPARSSAARPPHSLAATWEYGGQTSWIELRLTPEPDGRTRFALEHIAHVDDELWAQFGPGAVGIGWDQAVLALTLHLASGAEPPERETVESWQASEDGRQFSRLSSERWAEASIAAGTDAAEAYEAAARTTDFYSGEPAA